jgi:hypothetical protein
MLAVIQDDAESLALFREAMKGESGRPSTEESHNNVMELKSVHGTSKSYTVSRLKRDRPDLFERVVAGELSANRAAIEAGYRQASEFGGSTWFDRQKIISKLANSRYPISHKALYHLDSHYLVLS